MNKSYKELTASELKLFHYEDKNEIHIFILIVKPEFHNFDLEI